MDPVANVLTAVTNAQLVGKKRVVVPYSRFTRGLLDLLQQKEMIAKVRVQKSPSPKLVVTLRYQDGEPCIHGMKRMSKPGRRQHVKHHRIPYSYEGVGFIVISTPKGLMDERMARKEGLGGELVCAVW